MVDGRWSPDGEVSFLLAHADERSKMFDPFYFEFYLERVGGRAKKLAQDQREGEQEPLQWEATSGWWNTNDGSSRGSRGGGRDGSGGSITGDDGSGSGCTGGGASCARRLWPSAPQGSYGRIIEMSFRLHQ